MNYPSLLIHWQCLHKHLREMKSLPNKMLSQWSHHLSPRLVEIQEDSVQSVFCWWILCHNHHKIHHHSCRKQSLDLLLEILFERTLLHNTWNNDINSKKLYETVLTWMLIVKSSWSLIWDLIFQTYFSSLLWKHFFSCPPSRVQLDIWSFCES